MSGYLKIELKCIRFLDLHAVKVGLRISSPLHGIAYLSRRSWIGRVEPFKTLSIKVTGIKAAKHQKQHQAKNREHVYE